MSKQEDEAQMEGVSKNYKGKNPKPNFKPNSHEPKVKFMMTPKVGIVHEFWYDTTPIPRIANEIAYALEEERVSMYPGGQVTEAFVTEGAFRIVNLAFAKRMGEAAGAENQVQRGRDLKFLSYLKVEGPPLIYELAQRVGAFEKDGARFEIPNQAFHGMNHFYHGVKTNGAQGVPAGTRNDAWFVNVGTDPTAQQLWEVCVEQFNYYLDKAKPQVAVMIDGRRWEFVVPRTVSGFISVNAMIGRHNIQMPPAAQRAVQILVELEDARLQAGFPTAAQIEALRLLNVVVINWSKQVMESNVTNIVKAVHWRLASLFKAVLGWETYPRGESFGVAAQLLDASDPHVLSAPFQVEPGGIEKAFMVGSQTHYKFAYNQMEVMGSKSADILMMEWMESKKVKH